MTTFNPQYAKYIFEFGIVAISFTVAAIQLWQYDASRAVGTITLFIAAGARISPALLRMQQNYLVLTSSAGASAPTLELSGKLLKIIQNEGKESSLESTDIFNASITISNLKFGYDNKTSVIKDLNLSIEQGEFLAIAGPSGAGKSTLIDLCLGLQQPFSGNVTISGTSPSQAIRQWPGKVAYVPQSIHLANMSLRENLTFFSPLGENVDQRCMEVLTDVGLTEEFRRMNLTLDTVIGSDQNSLSGGQVQRIGIARALFSNPALLFLDESTSSLDAGTEHQISRMISTLPGKITRIVIAHRLSTIQTANRILYLGSEGEWHLGTFETLRKKIKDFDDQAKLMGL